MAATNKGQAWELSHSLWMGWAFLCGIFTWISFLYIGVRASRIKWILVGFIYMIPIIFLGTHESDKYDKFMGCITIAWIILQIVSVVHVFFARKEYLCWRASQDGDEPGSSTMQPSVNSQATAVDHHQEIFVETDDRAKKLNMFAAKVTDPEIREKVESIIVTTHKIHDLLAKHPDRIDDAKRFLNHYLDSACNIMEKYTEIVGQNLQTENIESLKTKVATILDTIKTTSEKQVEKLMEDDILDLETEISFLEKSIKSEGI